VLTNLFALLLAAIPLMGSPGPATLSLAALGSAFGVQRTMPYYAGIVAGTSGVLLMIATGYAGLILSAPRAVRWIGLIAAIYIVYLAYKIATAPVGTAGASEASVPTAKAGFLLAIGNPKAFAAISAVYIGHTVVTSSAVVDSVVKTGVLFLVIVGVNALWLFTGNAFSALLKDPVKGRMANILFAVLLLISVGLALWGLVYPS